MNAILEKRNKDAHKGDFGKVLLVAGSKGMCGAAILGGKAALRTGSGLVQIGVPEELFPIIQVGVPEATCVDRDEDIDLSIYDACAIGPGLGISTESAAVLKRLIMEYKGPLVIDADGLNLISICDFYGLLKEREGDTIITPHPGEARELIGTYYHSDMTRVDTVLALKLLTGAVSVLKGNETLVYDGNSVYGNTTGNPGMATAGSGDVLTGIILSLLGQGLSASEAAKKGVYIHGLAGDKACEKYGEASLISSDIIACLPEVLK